MQAKDIASLSLKILGIYSLIQAVPIIQPIFMMWTAINRAKTQGADLSFSSVALLSLPVIILIFIGIILIIFSSFLGSKLTSCQINTTDNSASKSDIQSIAFSVVGIFAFIWAAPSLLTIIFNMYIIHSTAAAGNAVINTFSHIAGLVAQIVLGLFLFFGSSRIVRFWNAKPNSPDSFSGKS